MKILEKMLMNEEETEEMTNWKERRQCCGKPETRVVSSSKMENRRDGEN
jgi:hypothetical protein